MILNSVQLSPIKISELPYKILNHQLSYLHLRSFNRNHLYHVHLHMMPNFPLKFHQNLFSTLGGFVHSSLSWIVSLWSHPTVIISFSAHLQMMHNHSTKYFLKPIECFKRVYPHL